MKIRPLGRSFLFAFLNETTEGQFVQKNKGRILLTRPEVDIQGTYARWAKVLAIGPEVKDFKNGDIVLIHPGKWTIGFTHDGVKVWKSDDEWVLATSDDESVAYDYAY